MKLEQELALFLLGLLLSGWWFLAVWHQLWCVYQPREVGKFSLLVWLGTFLASILAFRWGEPLGGLLIFVLLVLWQIKLYHWLFWEFWEKINIVLLGEVGLILLWLVWQQQNICSVIALGWWLIVCLSNFYWRHYRSFFWYPSGKVGFVPLTDLVLFGLGGGGLAIWQRFWPGVYLAILVTIAAGSILYLLSGRKIGNIGL